MYLGSAEARRWPSETKPIRHPSVSTTGTPGILFSARIFGTARVGLSGDTLTAGRMTSSSLTDRPGGPLESTLPPLGDHCRSGHGEASQQRPRPLHTPRGV